MGARGSAGLFLAVAMLLCAPAANATLIETETDGDEFGIDNGASNALEKAKYDVRLDPRPQSC